MRLKSIVLALLIAMAPAAFAAEPAGYYSSCENKNKKDLLQALNNKISNHTTLSYKSLNEYYPSTDAYPDGTIWDIYTTKHWPTNKTCGSYSAVGDCWNKEHSMPKSWFDDASPMASDLFHLYPTDGKVNGQRSNYPYGECAGGTTLSAPSGIKALGRLGSSTFAGYSGKVFEPDDEYKGDLARTYFYMAACYMHRNASWHSDMLAGNNYPFFKPWAINLLLKWSRQDPVSERETKRNDAVASLQGNRNPFIDHPELAEYIWGDKQNEVWTANGEAKPEINKPVNGSIFDMGLTAAGHPQQRQLAVRTSFATAAVSLTATAGVFSVSPASLTAAQANAGANVTVTYNPTATGSHTATLTIATGTARSTVTLRGSAVVGLPVSAATDVTEESFTANWAYVGDADAAGCYTLEVSDAAGMLDGYPKAVNAAAASYDVTGLTPSTTYSYRLRSASMTSELVSVTTADPVPSIELLFDGDLYFSTAPGEPSEAAEILIDADNIDSDITLTVTAPFELSSDMSDWRTTLTVPADEYRFFLRMNATEAGTYDGVIIATAGTYTADGVDISGTASLTPTFIETFEPAGQATYNPQTYNGSACVWSLVNGGFWDKGYNSDQSLRAGRDGNAVIEMAQDRNGGIGTVSFMAEPWSDTEQPTLAVETSRDGGTTWTRHGTVEVNRTGWNAYSVFCGVSGHARMRIVQSVNAKARFNIDDITITDSTTGLAEPEAERHAWNAFCRDGQLVVTVEAPTEIGIYTIDGLTLHYGLLAPGEHIFPLAPGTLAIISSPTFTRNVQIR